MIVNTYHINHLFKTYFKQTRLINQARKNARKSISDTIRLSTAGKKRLFEKMKEQAIDQVKIHYGGK
ncbi:MAG: hypothetical protein AMJ42_04480 [Deltaproteobacteria bacterium DG_8]|nr:MAG: hypothetical protein AMJ42_04480 [Deltaproteobacteria bacterium DG_8]